MLVRRSGVPLIYGGEMTSRKPLVINAQSSIDKCQVLKAAAGSPKRVMISGTLMNTKMNSNQWRIEAKDIDQIVTDIPNTTVDVQHSRNDWDIVGKGVEGSYEGEEIFYTNVITDPGAVEKFESGTWTSENMGISPEVSFSSLECSICGEDVRSCNHTIGAFYDGQICGVTAKGAHLERQGLTSNPAYKATGAGSIDFVTLSASINEEKSKILEETNMSSETKEDFKALLAEKDKTIETLISEKADLTAKVKKAEEEVASEETKEKEELVEEKKKLEEEKETVEEEKKKVEEEKEKVEAENRALKEQLDKFVTASRTVELEKRLGDKELVASILEKDMDDETFIAELEKIDKIQKAVAEKTPAQIVGSVPADNDTQTAEIKKQYDKIGTSLFGENYKELLGETKK